jgi:hypothetical protein
VRVPESDKPVKKFSSFATQVKSGRLRLVRNGSMLYYYVAEGPSDDFTFLQQSAFPKDDVKLVRLSGSVAGPETALDAIFTDLRVRTDELVGVSSTTPATASAGSASRFWLIPGALMVLAVPLSVGFLLWRRRQPGFAAAKIEPSEFFIDYLALTCSACGKRLKVKAEAIGKKVKCPECGLAGSASGSLMPHAQNGAERTHLPGTRFSRRTWLAVAAGSIAVILIGLAVFWLYPRSDPQSYLNVSLGRAPVPGVEESGFFWEELDQQKEPFRWTTGNAKLVIPFDKSKPPQKLAVELSVHRPPGVKQIHLDIGLNGRELFNDNIPVGKWKSEFDLTGADLGEKIVLNIGSDTFVPKGIMDKGTNTDPRTLGVQMREIKLLRNDLAQ